MSDKWRKDLTYAEYKEGVQFEKYLRVFDTKTKQIIVIHRDGYYPPKRLRELINLEDR